MLCANIILRRRWVESERLSYPIIQLPLEMTRPGGRFFRSPWMWIGLAVGAGINIINGLNFLFPSIPGLGGKLYDLRQIFTERPAWAYFDLEQRNTESQLQLSVRLRFGHSF